MAAGVAIAAGTFSGGWRIIHTLGRRVGVIDPPQGFAADTTSARGDPAAVAAGPDRGV